MEQAPNVKAESFYFFLLVLMSLSGCQSTNSQKNPEPMASGSKSQKVDGRYRPRTLDKGLTQREAAWRELAISNVKYKMQFNLSAHEPNFTGENEITFNLKILEPLTVDFTKGQIESLVVNDNLVKNVNYNGRF